MHAPARFSLSFAAALLLLGIAAIIAPAPARAEGGGVAEVKGYLTGKLQKMTAAAHDYVKNAEQYQKLADSVDGYHERMALEHGPEVQALIAKMQDNFRAFHNEGYETIEGITAGTKVMVDFDIYLDAGVPKSEATTDSPAATLVLKSRDGEILSDRQGNLFHYIIEPTLWCTKDAFVRRLSPAAAAKVAPAKALPRADVVLASAIECARKLDELQAVANRWQPTMDECVGALVWMTPTLNGYFDDWRESRYNPQAALGRYVAESRVLDMRGIMFSLQLMCNAILPELAKKDPALAGQLKSEYAQIMNFINKVDDRERRSGGKITIGEIEELAYQAKRYTDQLTPHLKQMAAQMNLKLPPKPTIA